MLFVAHKQSFVVYQPNSNKITNLKICFLLFEIANNRIYILQVFHFVTKEGGMKTFRFSFCFASAARIETKINDKNIIFSQKQGNVMIGIRKVIELNIHVIWNIISMLVTEHWMEMYRRRIWWENRIPMKMMFSTLKGYWFEIISVHNKWPIKSSQIKTIF